MARAPMPAEFVICFGNIRNDDATPILCPLSPSEGERNMKPVRIASAALLFGVLACGGRVPLGEAAGGGAGTGAVGTTSTATTGTGAGGSGVAPPPSSDPCDAAMPILTKYCGQCHGGRSLNERQGIPSFDFLFDVQKLTTTYTFNTTPPILFIKPGDPEHSRVYLRARNNEMPPPDLPMLMYLRPTTSDLSLLHYWISSCLGPPSADAGAPPGIDADSSDASDIACARSVYGASHAAVPTCPPAQTPLLLGLLAVSATPPGGQGFELRIIDPESGQSLPYPTPSVQNILPDLTALDSGTLAIDQKAHHLYLVGSTGPTAAPRIFTIDTLTGVVLANSPLSSTLVPSSLAVGDNGVLLALVWNGMSEELRSIDANSGTSLPYPNSSTPQVLSGLEWLQLGGAAFDGIANRWYVMGGNQAADRVLTIDIQLGLVTQDQRVSPSAGFMTAVNAEGMLLGLRWNGAAEELRSIDPSTGRSCSFPSPLVPNIISDLTTLSVMNLPIDNNANRIFAIGTSGNFPSPRLFVIDMVGLPHSRSSLTAPFAALVVACR
jgi:hypothetical protein